MSKKKKDNTLEIAYKVAILELIKVIIEILDEIITILRK